MALTPKQQIFVNEYLTTWNASEAARRAEYAKPGQQGHRLLKNVEIEAEIKIRLAERTMGPEEVLIRLGEQARAEYSRYITMDGEVNLVALIADGKAHLIKGIKETAHGKTIEFYDGQAALVHIGKHHKLFTDVSEVKGELEITDATDARERIAGRIAGIAARIPKGNDPRGTDTR